MTEKYIEIKDYNPDSGETKEGEVFWEIHFGSKHYLIDNNDYQDPIIGRGSLRIPRRVLEFVRYDWETKTAKVKEITHTSEKSLVEKIALEDHMLMSELSDKCDKDK